MTTHTPTPWTVEHKVEVYGLGSRPIADCGEGECATAEMQANAALIVRAVNAYQAIKDALGTDEDGEALIEVARNAHRVEQELAFRADDA